MKTPYYTLYVATDDRITKKPELCIQLTRDILAAGIDALQLRMKNCTSREMFAMGKELLPLTRRYDVPLIINDRVDVMLALDADGVHIGKEDLPLPVVRRLAGSKLVGCTAHNYDELKYAEKNGADYAGVGPVFQTATKSVKAPVLGVKGLHNLVTKFRIPCVAIGGIDENNVTEVFRTDAAGCCMISAIWHAQNPPAVIRRIRDKLNPPDGGTTGPNP